jgi:glucose-1-phosphate cytidylyltransferase|tara:strand:+ start:553 stop:1251 length:699 start_codon:yes stop_codon:yes gene_type:complete
MKCVILAGGKGSRISEISKNIPKPMIKILGKPIIIKIMQHYSRFGFKDFIIAAGYKKEIIKDYFKKNTFKEWNVKVIDTGLNTMTGGRIKRLEKFLDRETFMLTYGDGLSNVNIKKLLKYHNKYKKIGTLTAVRPPARFGAIKISKNKVSYFKEKSKLDEGWINGGFFVLEPEIFKYIKGDETFFEKEPLQRISKSNQLFAYKHKGFWQCMDTLRDKEILEKELKFKKNKIS